MTPTLRHRGPDDEGIWVDPDAGIALGHRRLAIVDLSAAGHEPMVSASGRLVVTFNGEIYNHADIRAQLDDQGRSPPTGWRGHSDIETLLEAIEHWGLEKALEEAVGMFAFALWDRQAGTLQLVRDRFGEKPLYYAWAGKDFVFASELKAIVAHPKFERDIDREAVAAYLAHLYVPAPKSIYRQARKLEPGTVLTLGPGRTRGWDDLKISRYWDYAAVVRAGTRDRFAREEEAIEAIEVDLSRAIVGQSVADVPIGAFLSGGVDSSTVVALYQKYSSTPVRTFSIGFGEAGFDEAGYAREVAHLLGTEHHEHYVTAADAMAVIPKLPTIYDEPFADASQIPTYLVSRFAREHVTVALTGDGGDELFAGYRRHYLFARLWSTVGRLPFALRRPTLAALAAGASAGNSFLRGGAAAEKLRKAEKALRVASQARTASDFASAFGREDYGRRFIAEETREGAHQAFELGPDASVIDELTYHDATTYLPGDILCKVDRASMAVSLETRVPFLDHRLAATAARVPALMKVRGSEGKLAVKSLLSKYLPRNLIDRPKAGFGVPIEAWLKGPLREWADDLLSAQRLHDHDLLDDAAVRSAWAEYQGGQSSLGNVVWAILMLEAWLAQ